MNYQTSYYWQQEGLNETSLVLQQLKEKKGGLSIVFVVMCRMRDMPAAGDFLQTRLLDWFRYKGLELCAKGRQRDMERLQNALEDEISHVINEAAQVCCPEKMDCTGIIGVGEKAVLFSCGRQRIYLIHRGFRMGKIKCLNPDKERFWIQQADMQPGIGIFIGTESFLAPYKEQTLTESMNIAELGRKENRGERCEKRLRELGMQAERLGEQNVCAVLLLTENTPHMFSRDTIHVHGQKPHGRTHVSQRAIKGQRVIDQQKVITQQTAAMGQRTAIQQKAVRQPEMTGEPQELQILQRKGYRTPLLVGEGAFSRVYRAWDEKKRRMVACKVSGKKAMLEREAEYLSGIKHPLFVSFFDYFEENDKAVLVMEYVYGSSLKTLLARRGKMSARQTVRMGLELADGLKYLHERDSAVIHRDIKPEHILIREDGAVKLIDMGCAGAGGSLGIAGSRGYAAPEQLLGNAPADAGMDVYGLGMVLLQMLPAEAPKGLWQILETCTRAEKAERVPDMRFLMGLLKSCNLKRKKRIQYNALTKFQYELNVCLL